MKRSYIQKFERFVRRVSSFMLRKHTMLRCIELGGITVLLLAYGMTNLERYSVFISI